MAQFYVKDNGGNLVPAKVLTDDSGKPVLNPSYNVPFPGSQGPVNWGTDRLALYDAQRNLLAPAAQGDLKYFIIPDNLDVQSFLATAITYSADVVTEAQFWPGQGNFQRSSSTVSRCRDTLLATVQASITST